MNKHSKTVVVAGKAVRVTGNGMTWSGRLEALVGSDREHFPEGFAQDEAEFEAALSVARQILEEETGK